MKFKLAHILSLFILFSNCVLSQNILNAKLLSEEQKQLLQYRAKYRAKLGVKKITTYAIKTNKRGKLKSKREIKNRKIFNKNGMLVISESFRPDLIIKTKYYYNKWNKETERQVYYNGELNCSTKVYYDIERNLQRTNFYNGDEKLISSKEKKINNNTVKKEVKLDSLSVTYYSRLMDLNYNMGYKNSYRRDSLNRILEWSIIDKYQLKKREIIYNYDLTKYTKKQIYYNQDGTQKHYDITEYNTKGFETKKNWYSKDGVLETINVFDYKFHK